MDQTWPNLSWGTVRRRFSMNTKAETVSYCKDLQELRCQRYEKDTPRQMFVSPNKSHTQQPGVCLRLAQQQQQQLSVSLQQSAFIKPNKLKHLACDATLRRTNQTTRPNREGRRLRRPSASRERERERDGGKIRTPTGMADRSAGPQLWSRSKHVTSCRAQSRVQIFVALR